MTRALGVEVVAAAAADALPTEAEQLELIPSRFKPGDERHAAVIELVRRDRAGRPPGARNLKTRDAIAFVRRVFGDPMVESARWLLHSPASLAQELGCSKLEAFDRLERVRADLRRFMYAPLAAVDGQGNAVAPVFNMAIGGTQQGGGDPNWRPWDYLKDVSDTPQETQQNQALPVTAPAVSHDDVSHGDAK